MNIIKLNAIDSTNSYMKKLVSEKALESYTIVVAKHQTLGRGQLGTKWVSDNGKNLTFSVLVNLNEFKIKHQFYLSMAVVLGVLTTVKMNVKTAFTVKWPNDILAEKDKLAGVLIENVLSGNFIKHSVIGIGLNVNQIKFPESIKNVTSLKNIVGTDFNKEELLKSIIANIQFYIDYVQNEDFIKLKEIYLDSLYKYKQPVMFEDKNGTVFLGKIVDVFEDGRLVIELENETVRKFNLKEIKFVNR